MANISIYGQQAMLNWILGGAAVVSPAMRAVALSSPFPNSTAGSEIGTASGYTRQTVTFGTCVTPAGSVSNINACTFGPFLSTGVISGAAVWDTAAVGAGTMIWYGSLATARTIAAVGDFIVLNPGALIITLF